MPATTGRKIICYPKYEKTNGLIPLGLGFFFARRPRALRRTTMNKNVTQVLFYFTRQTV